LEISEDPVLFYQIPEDGQPASRKAGQYELAIHDSIYRGREDFVYRIAVSEQPFITQMFPLGGRAGVKTVASVAGWNLPETELTLDTTTERVSLDVDEGPRFAGTQARNEPRNRLTRLGYILYAVDTLPEYTETESNDSTRNAQVIDLPIIINGRIDQPKRMTLPW